MPIDPGISLSVKPVESPVVRQSRFLDMQNAQQRVQEGGQLLQQRQLENEQRQRDAAAQKVLSDLLSTNTTIDQPTGHLKTDHSAIIKGLSSAGFGPEAIKYDAARRADEKAIHDEAAATMKEHSDKAAALGQLLNPLSLLNDDEAAKRYPGLLAKARQDGILDDDDASQLSGDWLKDKPGVTAVVQQGMTMGQQLDEAQKKRAAAQQDAEMRSKTLVKSVPNSKDASKMENHVFGWDPATNDYTIDRGLDKSTVEPALRPQTITVDGKGPVAALRTAQGDYIDATTKQPIAGHVGVFIPPSSNTGDARMDRSYQFNSSQLAALQKPIDDAVSRISRLQDTLSQNDKQSDALVAPELLTIIAGGMGSGLRINEAEISRVGGGRSAYDDLQAAVNKWRRDPKASNSITDGQRAEIRALLEAVSSKVYAKQDALTNAGQELIDATDVTGHRKALDKARQALAAASRPTGSPKLGDTKTFQNGNKGRWDGTGWVLIK